MLAEKLDRLDSIVAELKASPLAANIRVFGSAVTQPGLVPGDIDVFIKGPYSIQGEECDDALWQILMLAVKDGYHGNYGHFDPFRLVRPASGAPPYLLTRSEDYSRYNVCWINAAPSTAERIIADGRAGIPILEFNRVFRTEFALFVEPDLPVVSPR